MLVETVKIKNPDKKGEYIIIARSEFNPETDKFWDADNDGVADQEEKPVRKRKAADDADKP